MSVLKWINVALRGVMETGIVLALAYWGYHTGESASIKILLAILAPAIGFGFWGAVDFRNFGHSSEYLRLTQELIVCALVTYLLFIVEQHLLAWIFAIISVIHHMLVYLLGERLLKDKKAN